MDIVVEATKPELSTPQYESVAFLCDSANSSGDAAVDVVRAVRRRITDSDAKVQLLTVLVLGTLMKNCENALHVEVASQKGLLRDLQNVAIRTPCITEKERMAKEAALTLILNLSIWFTGHPDGRLYILTTISDDVRHAIGPNAFEGIQPDTNTQINSLAMRQQQQQRNPRFSRQPRQSGRQQQQRQRQQGLIVDAVGINLPTEEDLAAMLDCCMTLAEYLNNAKVQPDGSIKPDDVISGFRDKILADHKRVTVLLSSDLKLDNRDVLRDVFDSQSALIQRLQNDVKSHPDQTPPQSQATDVVPTERYLPRVTTPNPPAAAAASSQGQETGMTPAMNPPMSQVEPVTVPTALEAGTQEAAGEAEKSQPSPAQEASKAMENLFVSAPVTESSVPTAEPPSREYNDNVESLLMKADTVPPEPIQSVVEKKEEVLMAGKEEKQPKQEDAHNPPVSHEKSPEEKNKQPAGEDDEFDAFLEGRLSK
ncbi:hypothetical protein MOQ_007197 [Trypanosoma cruzi marinkellei]|uniref:VHS domain-containing protein n=1 Tax=Trypanosoma cruzi marinkellei TaxID=85056 RepID=K2N358_TRYCR|nr:hypothetical protein MOQ_007197 [Trypanosoma cruzi marinkellei]